MPKTTVRSIKASKGKNKLVMITAYDYLFAKLFDDEVDIILVGDSLNMSFCGKSDTLSATLKQMIYHTNAVCAGAKNSFVVCDMPFGTYLNENDALKNCIKVYQKTEANAVKIEGGESKAKIVKKLTDNGIAVVGHIGLMPQFVKTNGYAIAGKNEEDLNQLIKDAKAIEDAGAFLLVIEGCKPESAKKITQSIKIPTIGIGAGIDTDGQVLVWSDMLGFFEDFKPKFVKEYLDGSKLVRDSIKNYTNDVRNKKFPTKKECY